MHDSLFIAVLQYNKVSALVFLFNLGPSVQCY